MTARPGLSKSRILAGLQCPGRLWWQVHRPELGALSGDSRSAITAGNDVGAVARALHPQGHLIGMEAGIRGALAETRRWLSRPGELTLFEATFERDGVVARTDLLFRMKGAWRMTEVKAATRAHRHHVEDAAIQTWVLEGAGVRPRSVGLALVDPSLIYAGDGCYDGLFRMVDVTAAARELRRTVGSTVLALRRILMGPEPPPDPGLHCTVPYACEFVHVCRSAGSTDLCSGSEEPVKVARADPRVSEELSRLPYPRRFLCLHSIAPAVPLWAGTRPYEPVPFQLSIREAAFPGADECRLVHFLEPVEASTARAVAETLVSALGTEGSIVVYGRTPTVAIEGLAKRFPDLATRLRSAVARMADLQSMLICLSPSSESNQPRSLEAAAGDFLGHEAPQPLRPDVHDAYERWRRGSAQDGGEAGATAHERTLRDRADSESLALMHLTRALEAPAWADWHPDEERGDGHARSDQE